MAKRNRPIPVPDFPEGAAALLSDLRSGKRRARYRRAQSGRDIEIRPQLLRGPFGPLLLSQSSRVQSLALADWLGGDQLWVEIQDWDVSPVATDRVAGAEQPAEKPAEAAALGSADTFGGANPLRLDHRLLMPRQDLERLLERAYPPVTRGTRECLIVDALMLSNELAKGDLRPSMVKTLVRRIVEGLQAPDGCPINLVADDGSTARAEYLFRHRKAMNAGYRTVGLREGSNSTVWIEPAVVGRYTDIRKRLDAAEEQHRAS